MIQSSKGVFLSYASEDASVAKRICDALRMAGIEVWFDQSELRGGDAWDQKIRQQIRDCALFVPVISAHTQERSEGYFRLEWKLAVDRSHLMAAEKAFLVPMVVDATTEPEALVPAQFREVQWTRLQAGEVPAAFVERIAALLHQPVAHHVGSPGRAISPVPPRRWPVVLIALSVAVVVGLVIATAMRGGWLGHKVVPKLEAATASAAVATTAAAIPEKSIAVLPFVDMSEKQDEGYFSDGLSEELIDMLTRVPDIKVPARTSSFYFKGKPTTIKDIGAALGVAHVLEGSVRKSGKTLRVTAQLIRVDNGYHLWSETYDRKLDDIFKIQDEIAAAVVNALKISLLPGMFPQARATSNSDAYQLYLQSLALTRRGSKTDLESAITDLRHTVQMDPTFAPSWAALSAALSIFSQEGYVSSTAVRDEAMHAAAQALKLDPGSSSAYVAIARINRFYDGDWIGADAAAKQAVQLDPRNAAALRWSGYLAAMLGRYDEGIRLLEQAVSQDPLLYANYDTLATAYAARGRLDDAETASRTALTLNPKRGIGHYRLAEFLLFEGKLDRALAEAQLSSDPKVRLKMESIVYYALGRTAEAESALAEFKERFGRDDPFSLAEIYARLGEENQALTELERAAATSHAAFDFSDITLNLNFQALAGNPRFKMILHKLRLPDRPT